MAVDAFDFHGLGQARLVLQVQLITFAAHEQVQLIAHGPDKVQGAAQLLILVAGEVAVVLQVAGLLDVRLNPGDPQHGVVIAQAAMTFL